MIDDKPGAVGCPKLVGGTGGRLFSAPRGENVHPGVQLYMLGARLVQGGLQGVPTRVLARVPAGIAGEIASPGLNRRGIISGGIPPNLKEDITDAQASDVFHDGADIVWRLIIPAGDPQGPDWGRKSGQNAEAEMERAEYKQRTKEEKSFHDSQPVYGAETRPLEKLMKS